MSRSNTPLPGQSGLPPAPRQAQAPQQQVDPLTGRPAHYPLQAAAAPQWQQPAPQQPPQSDYYAQASAQQPTQHPLYQPVAGSPRGPEPYLSQQQAAAYQAAAYPPAPAQQAGGAPAAQWPPQSDPRMVPRAPAPDTARFYAAQQPGHPAQTAPSMANPVDPLRTARTQPAQPYAPPASRHPAPGQLPANAPQWASDQRLGEPSLDFGHYGAPHAPMQAPAQPSQRHTQHPHPGFHDQDQAGLHAPQSQAQGYHVGAPAHHSPAQPHAAAQHDPEHEDYGEEEIYDEEPRRGKRTLLVAAALVGAIGLGGSLAYVYKNYGSSMLGGKPPILKADAQPAKTRPAAPGGKEFANSDRKIFGRLGDDAAQPGQSATTTGSTVASAEAQNDGGPRKVQIISIAPPNTAAAPSAPPAPTVAVPGMTIENVGPPPGQRALPPVIPAQAPPPPAPPPAAPKVVAKAPPPPAPPATVAAAEAPRPPAVARKPAPKPAAAESPATPVAAASNGFVAVLSSQKSRMDALKVYADIQQKFGQVLSNKPADVQEANLGEKGVYYRAVVGPPGSREAASTVCTQLKAAGFSGCWVTAY